MLEVTGEKETFIKKTQAIKLHGMVCKVLCILTVTVLF